MILRISLLSKDRVADRPFHTVYPIIAGAAYAGYAVAFSYCRAYKLVQSKIERSAFQTRYGSPAKQGRYKFLAVELQSCRSYDL